MKILLSFILLISIPSFAKESTFKINAEKYFWLFEENSKWVLNTVELNPNKLPNVLDTRYFDSEKSALSEIKKTTRSAPLSKETLKNIPTVSTEVHNQPIWKVEHEWSWEWEQKYAEWITANSELNFLAKHNIATDCADAVMAYRWIFARIHKLPVAQKMGMERGYITQDTMKVEWLSIPSNEDWEKDERFFVALDNVQKTTYTGTLFQDGYAIDLIRDAFIPGFHYVGGGHSMVSIGIIENKSIMFNSSTTPREVRDLFILDYITDQLYTEETGGLMRMRWPYKKDGEWALTDKQAMPFYGLGQYSPDLLENNYESAKFGIYLKLGLEFTKFDIFQTTVNSAYMQLLYRVWYVLDAYSICSTENCSPGSVNYENHSTFSRDKRIARNFESAFKLKEENGSTNPEYQNYWDAYADIAISIDGYGGNGDSSNNLLFKDLAQIWKDKKYTSDPRDSVKKRWGLE